MTFDTWAPRKDVTHEDLGKGGSHRDKSPETAWAALAGVRGLPVPGDTPHRPQG